METIIKALRECYDDGCHCPLTWHRHKDGYLIRFSHVCGDGCCSWSNEYFIDQYHSLWNELQPHFAEYPNGEDYPPTEEEEYV